ncbi:hypothetical protein VTH82DRAFT_6085 [Thermothelomyces myriococcoides]
MRPELLPPLIIPKRRTRTPVLVAVHPRRQDPEKPQEEDGKEEKEKVVEKTEQSGGQFSIFRPSCQTPRAPLPASAFPNPPPERKPEDIDNIEAFSFYNPCLLPPSPVAPSAAARSYPDPRPGFPHLGPAPLPPDTSPQRWRQRHRQQEEAEEEEGGNLLLPPPPPPPSSRPDSAQPGLRRSNQPLNRDFRRRRDNRAAASVPPPASRPPRTPPPKTQADPGLPPSPFSIQRSPSRLYARPPRRRGEPGRESVSAGAGVQQQAQPWQEQQQQEQQNQKQKHPISLPRWDACGHPGFEASRPPSPVVAAQPRLARPPVEWDVESLPSMYADDIVESPYGGHDDDNSNNNNNHNHGSGNNHYRHDDDDSPSSTPDSWDGRDDGGYVTPFLARWQSQEGRRGGGEERGRAGGRGSNRNTEDTALRDLWGVIDELLGPGRRLGDYDALSMTSSMNGESAAAARAAATAATTGDHRSGPPSTGRPNYSSRESRQQNGVPGEGAWWRAVRQGLLLS